MAVVVNEGPFGSYGNGYANDIDALIELLTPSSLVRQKLMAEPDFSLPDDEVCRLIRAELEGIKAANANANNG